MMMVLMEIKQWREQQTTQQQEQRQQQVTNKRALREAQGFNGQIKGAAGGSQKHHAAKKKTRDENENKGGSWDAVSVGSLDGAKSATLPGRLFGKPFFGILF